MNKQHWLIVFALSLIADILGIVLNNETIQFIAKPVIVLALIGYFFVETKSINSSLKKWIFLALLFSWLGDVLLMFQPQHSIFFLLGLSAFLIAHIFYIIFFHRLRVLELVKSRVWALLLVAVYYAALITILSPYLNDMKLPVRIYGIVISAMLLLAIHMLFISRPQAGRLILLGAVLFVISDSVLAINKFYHPFQAAGITIMLTYGLAQFLIVKGAVSYLQYKRQ